KAICGRLPCNVQRTRERRSAGYTERTADGDITRDVKCAKLRSACEGLDAIDRLIAFGHDEVGIRRADIRHRVGAVSGLRTCDDMDCLCRAASIGKIDFSLYPVRT